MLAIHRGSSEEATPTKATTTSRLNECPFAKILREAADDLEQMSIEEIRALLIEAAEMSQRSHELLIFAKETIEGGLPKGHA